MNPTPVQLDQPAVAWQRTRPVLFIVVAALLTLHWLLAVGSKRAESVTSDEIAHLTGGFTYWQFNDYRIQPENGNLPQRWAALPAWLEGAKFPPLEQNEYWRASDAWVLGHQFFYETGEDHFPRLMAGRAMIAVFSVAIGLLVFCWSRRLFGPPGGLVSLVFFVFSPTCLAHGALVTSDACMAFFFLASVGAFWRHLHSPRRVWGILSAVTFGLACVAKFNAGLLFPMLAIMAVVRAVTDTPWAFGGRSFATTRGKLGALTLSILGHGFVGVFVIWASFGFRYSAFNPLFPAADHFIRPWAITLANIGGIHAEIIRLLAAGHILPEAYLYGYSFVIEMSGFRAAFLDGAYSYVGWVRFFPLAFLYKSTLPLLLGCFVAAGVVARRWRPRALGAAMRRDLYRVTPLLVLFTVYWLVSLASHLNIGQRHILPTYPVLFIFLGVFGRWLNPHLRFAAVFVILLLGWQIREAIKIYPHYLAYFNPLAGGPGNGHRHLVDSSLDWGQDLPGLKAWLARETHGEPVYLSYFGSGEPAYYGINARRLPFLNGFRIPQPWVKLQAGVYCVSATMLEAVYSDIRGPWTLQLENEYQRLRGLEPLFEEYTEDPQRRAELNREASPQKWSGGWTRLDRLRFARLCYFLRVRQPEAQVGYSILIYRLNAAEIAAATSGSLADWAALIERTVNREQGR